MKFYWFNDRRAPARIFIDTFEEESLLATVDAADVAVIEIEDVPGQIPVFKVWENSNSVLIFHLPDPDAGG